MKKLILLLLFIPLISLGQLTLEDILSVEDKQSYLKLMIEKGFEEDTQDELKQQLISYSYKILDNISVHAIFRKSDSISDAGVMLMYVGDILNRSDSYDSVYDIVKEKCKFIEVRKTLDTNFAYYGCDDENADPRLKALDELVKKEVPDNTLNISFAMKQIGFAKKGSLFTIHYAINEMTVDVIETLVKDMIELKKLMDKEEEK